MSELLNSRRKIFPEKYFSKLRGKIRDRERQKLKFVFKKKFSKQAKKNRYLLNQYTNSENKKNSNMIENFDGIVGNSINNISDMNEWQYQHQIAYWKSRALSLEAENKMLHEHIRKFYSEDWNKKTSNTYDMQYSSPNVPNDKLQEENYHTVTTNTETQIENEDNLQDDNLLVKFVVDDTWLQFMEHTERHRRQLRKKREAERATQKEESGNSIKNHETSHDADEESYETTSFNNQEHINEMNRLYGKGTALIRACETAIQFSFEHHAKKTVLFWPHIPLKI